MGAKQLLLNSSEIDESPLLFFTVIMIFLKEADFVISTNHLEAFFKRDSILGGVTRLVSY